MKLSLILKLFGFVCLLSVFSIPAQSAEPKYDFKCKDTPVETALLELRKLSGYDFVYQKELLKDFGPVTCNYSEMSLPQILNRIFDENNISYQIVDKTIILSKSEKEQPYFKSTLSGTVVDQNDEPPCRVPLSCSKVRPREFRLMSTASLPLYLKKDTRPCGFHTSG